MTPKDLLAFLQEQRQRINRGGSGLLAAQSAVLNKLGEIIEALEKMTKEETKNDTRTS